MIRTLYYTFTFLIFGLFAQAQAISEENLSLNGIWAFRIDPNNVGEQENWYKSDLEESSWEAMTVPSNWDIQNQYSHYVGKGWYRKTISIPKNWQGRTIRLNFEGVYFASKVWLNGNLLGTNNNGFLPFEFDVTRFLNQNGSNTIVVCADNAYRLGAVWNWGGIRRPVKLIANHAVRIVQQHITSNIDLVKGSAEISVKVFLQNADSSERSVQGEVILNKENLYKKSLAFSAAIPANSQKVVIVKASLSKDQVHLWHFDDPFLYDCTSSINSGIQVLHQVNDRFGLRKIEVDNQRFNFKLNGESVRLMGFNLVPEDRTTGNTLPLWRVKEDVDLMKEAGCNMTRLTHLPVTEEMLDYLDEKGILIFSEISLWGEDEKVYKDNPIINDWLKRLIFDTYNHPSIIGWSVGNELGRGNLHVMDYVEAAIKLVKTLDSSRLAVVVSNTADRPTDPIQFSDLGLLNKYGKNLRPVTEKIHQLHPDKLLFYTEYGTAQLGEELDANTDAKAIIDSIRDKPYLMGASLWTFNDYRSSFYRTKEFSENRSWGVVDVFRQKKKAYEAFKKEYAPIRTLAIEDLVVNTAKKSSATIVLTPRNVLDLPAYTMNNYRLVWKLKDEKGQIKQAGFGMLPIIRPGDSHCKQTINWQVLHPLSLQIELVSPLNYAVYDTTIYFRKPPSPKIIYAEGVRTLINDFPQTGMIRVVFDKNPSATSYKLKYGVGGLTEETAATSNHYIDITKLDRGQTYQVALVSINSAGESEVSDIKKITTGYSPFPPIIRYTEPADKGFFVGYDTQEDDYIFQVQYTTRPGDYSQAKIIQSTNKGVLFVPNLQNGQTYYYRLKRIQQKFYESLWSEEITVTPDGGQLPAAPVIQGVIRKENIAIVCFEPIKKAIGYIIEYRSNHNDSWKSIEISAAHLSQYAVDKIDKNKRYTFRIASLNACGRSAFSEELLQNKFVE